VARARERIRGVLTGDALGIVFQPVVDIRTGAVVGAEALARFNAEPRRTPDVWFEEAWSVGLGLELELEAIRRALASLDELPPGTYIAINTAPSTLCSDALLELLQKQPLDRVVVELTEHARVDDYAATTAAVARLRALGVQLSVDDAGAGFSSFQHVLYLRPDIIKLDRSLTTDIDGHPVRAALASAMVTFAASLGARICAEGIEKEGELVALQKLGIGYGQGYFLARPAPLPLGKVPGGMWMSRSLKRQDTTGFVPSPAIRSSERLDALAETSLMDTAEGDTFDRFTRLVSATLAAPVALISLVDERRQFLKSAIGLPEPWSTVREIPLTHSFCQHTVTTGLPLVIDDARAHPLVRESAAVTELGFVAYAGVPVFTAHHEVLGALCAIDHVPRAWTADDIARLEDLSAILTAEVELRRARRNLRKQEALFRRMFDHTDTATLLCDLDGRIARASRRLCELMGYREDELRGQPRTSFELAGDGAPDSEPNKPVIAEQRETEPPRRLVSKDGRRVLTLARTSVVRDAMGRATFTIATVEPDESEAELVGVRLSG